jgi:hypothetical protein
MEAQQKRCMHHHRKRRLVAAAARLHGQMAFIFVLPAPKKLRSFLFGACYNPFSTMRNLRISSRAQSKRSGWYNRQTPPYTPIFPSKKRIFEMPTLAEAHFVRFPSDGAIAVMKGFKDSYHRLSITSRCYHVQPAVLPITASRKNAMRTYEKYLQTPSPSASQKPHNAINAIIESGGIT